MLTSKHISIFHTKNNDELLTILKDMLPRYGIDNDERMICFLAQCGHESGGFTKFEENLNYSASRLIAVWPKRFATMADAEPYHRQPEKIANKVYGGRMGNGTAESGDGWKYRGRGCIMTTGKTNYTKLATTLKIPLSDAVAYCGTLKGAIESACIFWKTNNLNRFVDAKDFEGLTIAINGRLIGYTERKLLYDTLKKI